VARTRLEPSVFETALRRAVLEIDPLQRMGDVRSLEQRLERSVGVERFFAVVLAVFAVLCLYRIETDPNLYFDEIAYLRAARMFAGQIAVGRILGSPEYEIYVYDQFAAQAIPLALQAAGVAALGSDVVATRLVSFAASAVALLGAALLLRPRLGSSATAWMLAFAVGAPLVVIYSRAGHYIALSMLYSVAIFGCLLWLRRRWDAPWALATGLLLAASLYQYQLSWFVPVFAALAFAVSPDLWKRPGVLRVAGCVAGAAVAVAAPGWLWLETGLAAVNAQTFDRAVWNEPGSGAAGAEAATLEHVVAIAPSPLAAADREVLDARLARSALTRRHVRTTDGESALWITGAVRTAGRR